MSINVTVRGNPISIKRGKMVTYDADSDFEHRRRIRLQQVREQSKEIAADVRNRVRREKEKQLTKVERKGEQDLKRWQARKLLALQQQYQECLKEVGSAHTRAALEPDENQILQEQSEKNQVEANIRQEIASNKVRKEKERIQLELKKPIELREKVKKFEDERVAMATKSNHKQKKKRKKSKAVVSDSESEIYASDVENISSNIIRDSTPETSKGKHTINLNISSPEYLSDPSSISVKSPSPSPKSKSPTSQTYRKITKISDRIKERKSAGSSEKKKKYKLQVNTYELIDIPSESNLQTDLPYVPTTTLTPEPVTKEPETNIKDKPIVQKINKDSIRVNPPSDRSESTEFKELAEKRDKIAYDRGVRAIEKEKIERDFKELMQKLPLLQKQERLSQMKNHDPTFHMPEDRLEELERRKQNKIENIFEKYYHKSKVLETPLVTIRPIPKPLPDEELKLPFRALDVTEESNPQLNVAEWTTEDVQPCPCAPESSSEDKQKTLIDLLQRVNKQRELLLHEVQTLPPSNNLQKIIQEDEILKLIGPSADDAKITKTVGTSPPSSGGTKSKRRARAVTTSSDSSTEVKKKQKKKTPCKKQKVLSTNATQTSPTSEISKRFVCSCESATSGPCQCKEKWTKAKKQNVCFNCGQEFIMRQEKEQNLPKKMYKCPCGEIYEEGIGKKLKDDTKKVCEIIIKASSQSDVKVHKEEEKSAQRRVILNVSKSLNINIKPSTGNDVSSSTTYMSLPDQRKTQGIQTSSQNKRQEYKDLLHFKPKQSNINTSDSLCCPCEDRPISVSDDKKEITPRLLRYIKKLLSMSRESIDELIVSSISEVSTPGQSVVDVSENISNPFVQLQNVMQHYNLSLNDIQKHLIESSTQKQSEINEDSKTTQETVTSREGPPKSQSCSPPKETVTPREVPRKYQVCLPPKENVTSREGTQKYQVCSPPKETVTPTEVQQKSQSCSPSKDSVTPRQVPWKYQFCSPPKEAVTPREGLQKYQSISPSKETVISREVPQESQPCSSSNSPKNHEEAAEIVKNTYNLQPDDMKEIPYGNIVSRYKLVTQACCERINQLTKMIDDVRIEKERLLSPDVSDKSNGNKTGYSSSSSMSQTAVDEYLLAIDKVPLPKSKKKSRSSTTGKKRKTASPKRHKKKTPTISPKKQAAATSDNSNFESSPPKISPKENITSACLCPKENTIFDCLCPKDCATIFAQDVKEGIPKYTDSRTKPPPALLRNAKFNLDIDMTPHELSTIAEMDTVSEAAVRSRTPEVISKQTLPPREPYLPCDGVCGKSINDQTPKRSSLKKSSRPCSPVSPPAGHPETQAQSSERSTSSPEDVETALRNIGPGWIITTSKITKEAFALSSSSSSLETSFKKRVSFQDSNNTSSSNSEIRDALSKDLRERISSSTPNSSRLSPNLQNLQDFSEIRDPTIFPRDASQHRTSTPVQNSKSPRSNQDLFTSDSDLSSVKMYNEEFLFLSIPNVSLDTNKSLSRLKK